MSAASSAIPGDGINGLLGALQKRDDFEFVQVRHEEMAAFMASAHAKFTGELGVCIATSGPGASHLITGLYDAKLDHQPVLAIAGQTPRSAIGSTYQQEIDLQSMFKDVASDYVATASAPAQVRHLLDRAVRIAVSGRRVTALVIPHDLQELPMEQPPRAARLSTFRASAGRSPCGAAASGPAPRRRHPQRREEARASWSARARRARSTR